MQRARDGTNRLNANFSQLHGLRSQVSGVRCQDGRSETKTGLQAGEIAFICSWRNTTGTIFCDQGSYSSYTAINPET